MGVLKSRSLLPVLGIGALLLAWVAVHSQNSSGSFEPAPLGLESEALKDEKRHPVGSQSGVEQTHTGSGYHSVRDPQGYPHTLSKGISAYLAVDQLPLRKFGIQSREITSYNTRGFNYDYGNYLYIKNNEMYIMEDEGSGCMYRMFLIFNHQVQNYHLFRWIVRVDGVTAINITLKSLLEGNTYPFTKPLNGARTAGHQGLFTSVPVCYHSGIQISFWHATMYNGKNFNRDMMYDCVVTATYCHHMPMWNVFWHRFASPQPQIASFAEWMGSGKSGLKDDGDEMFTKVKNLLSNPTSPPPWSGTSELQHSEGFQSVQLETSPTHIYTNTGSGVITQILLAMDDPKNPLSLNPTPLNDWNNVFLTIRFDSASVPQVHSVPLGFLFGANLREWLHKAEGYLNGCTVMPIGAGKRAWTGYLFYPMPYWESVSVSLHTSSHDKPTVHYKVVTTPNEYLKAHTGHFHVEFHQQTPTPMGEYFTFLDYPKGWGHVVGMNIYLEGLRDTIQGDPQLYYDHSKSALLQGTGIEDWFNYAHGWEFQLPRNQSDPLCGVPAKGQGGYWVTDPKKPRKKPTLKLHGDKALINGVHAYRRMPVDVLAFNDGIKGSFEIGSNWTHNNYRSAEDMATTVFFYGKPVPGMTLIMTLELSDPDSRSLHGCDITGDGGYETSPTTSKYVGCMACAATTKRVMPGSIGRNISFVVNVERNTHQGLLLRRNFDYTAYNQKAIVSINGRVLGTLLALGGNPHFTLAESDLLIPPSLVEGHTSITITIQPQSKAWLDIGYDVYYIH